MKKVIFVVVFLSLFTIFIGHSYAVPIEISYQGYLSSIGTPVNGATNITFKLYNHATEILPANIMWDSGPLSVTVSSGVYTIVLGQMPQPAIDPLIFDQQLWLGVTVQSDGEMSPRQKLSSVSYSIKADSANTAVNADTVDGLHAADLAPGEHNHDGTDIDFNTLHSAQIMDGTITDTDISPAALIDPSKIDAGSGSGLDADLLDGQTSTDFSPATHSHGGDSYTKAEVDALLAALETRISSVEIGMPPDPTNLSAIAVSWNEIQLDWSHSSYYETGFYVERSLDGVNFSQVTSLPASTVTYTDFSLLPLTTYYYRVKAYNQDNETGYSNTDSATTEDTTEITGRLDTAFGTGGVAIHHDAAGGNKGDWGKGMTLDASGRILVAGYSYSSASDIDMALWRYNPDGSIDPSFGTGGFVTHGNAAGGNSYDFGMDVAVDSTGRIFVTGYSIGVDLTDDMVIWCYNPDGTPDTSFDLDGILVDPRTGQDGGFAIAVDQNDKIVVAGNTYSVGYEMTVWRYSPDGTPDTTFDMDGVKIHTKTGTSEIGHSIAFDASGKIVVAGRGPGSGTGYDMTIWRHNTDGSPDTSFDTDGIVTHSNAAGGDNADYGNDVAIDGNGKIVVVGHSVNNFANKDMVVWRYNPDGTLDNTFDTDGFVTHEVQIGGTDEAHALTLDSSGRILVSGLAHNSSGNYDMTLWRFNSDGSLDNTFDQDGFLQHDAAAGGGGNNSEAGYAINLDSSGRILVGGYSYNLSGNSDLAIWRFK